MAAVKTGNPDATAARWLAIHTEQHRKHLEMVRSTHSHLGDTADGAWGLFAPRDRPMPHARWIAIHAVQYVLPIDRRWDAMVIGHNGQRFDGSFSYHQLRDWYPDAIATWDAALCKRYPALPL